MKKLLLLTALVLTCLGTGLYAQYATYTPLPDGALLNQDPEAKAALIAAADDTVEERIDDASGQVYYVRRFTSPWSGESTYQLVVFDAQKETFVEREDYALWKQQISPAQGGEELPEPEVQDSCRQNSLIPEQMPNKAKPRRSSTVKILAHKF
jgi:hypothetical protein